MKNKKEILIDLPIIDRPRADYVSENKTHKQYRAILNMNNKDIIFDFNVPFSAMVRNGGDFGNSVWPANILLDWLI